MRNPVREISRMIDKKDRFKSGASSLRTYSEGAGTFQTPGKMAVDIAQVKQEVTQDQENIVNLASRVSVLESKPPDVLFQNYTFNNVTTVVVEHNLGCYPVVQLLEGVGYYGQGNCGEGVFGGTTERSLLTPFSVVYNSENKVTVTLSNATSGEVLIIGRQSNS